LSQRPPVAAGPRAPAGPARRRGASRIATAAPRPPWPAAP